MELNESQLESKEGMMIIAFDGMDYDLIDDFELDSIKLDEFGTIDNDTGISRRMTCELFTSFLTGETHEVHSVEGLRRRERSGNPVIEKIKALLTPEIITSKLKGLMMKSSLHGLFSSIVNATTQKYDRTDIQTDTFLEKIEASKPLYVPVWNPQYEWQCDLPDFGLNKGYSTSEVVERGKKYTEMRKRKFWGLSHEFWGLIFLHLHDPDLQQDMGIQDLKPEYFRHEEFANKVIEEFSDNWVLIFMSDHGVIQDDYKQHNENAFYSSNIDLFGDEIPHITDFHDKILEINQKIN